MTTNQRVSLEQIRDLIPGKFWTPGRRIDFQANWIKPDDEYLTWASLFANGKSYMVGDSLTDAEWIKKASSRLVEWQKLAYQWARENPASMLVISYPGKTWKVYQRGEVVEFYLPYQDEGGENAYMSRDGKSKLHTNND